MDAGAYTIINQLTDADHSTAAGTIHTFPGVLSDLTISRNGLCSSWGYKAPVTKQCDSYSHTYTEPANPGGSETYYPPVPKTGHSHCPPNEPWSMPFVINAPGNENAYAKGSITLDPNGFYNITFLYHINIINGQAFYAYEKVLLVNQKPQQTWLVPIGPQPAAVATG